MILRYAGSTDVGRKRGHNEDNFFLLADEGLFVVADGMGGHAAGEVASQIAVDALANFYLETSKDREMTWPTRENKEFPYGRNRLEAGVKLCNQRVHEMQLQDPNLGNMGTTIVSLACGADGVWLAHVGDSRAYHIREQSITLLTEDHSLLNDYLRHHDLSPEEIEAFPHKNVIVRALGMAPEVLVDSQAVFPIENDTLLLCSDGLTTMLDDQSILQIVAGSGDDVDKACQSLVDEANERGGYDNTTVVLVRFLASEGAS